MNSSCNVDRSYESKSSGYLACPFPMYREPLRGNLDLREV